MKFFFFHLMPYADLDPSYDEKYDSAWVTLPNSYYDRKKGHELYNRYLDEIEYADTVGFDGVCVNEHHANAYGMMPIPGIMAGAPAEQSHHRGGRIRHAGHDHRRAADRRFRARHRRGISQLGRQPGHFA
jgi:hypothetical protein